MSRQRWLITGIVRCPIRGYQSIEMCTCMMFKGYKPCETCGIEQDPDESVRLVKGRIKTGPGKRKAEIKPDSEYAAAKKREGKLCCDCGKLITKSAERCLRCSMDHKKKTRPKIRIGKGPKRGKDGKFE